MFPEEYNVRKTSGTAPPLYKCPMFEWDDLFRAKLEVPDGKPSGGTEVDGNNA